MTRDPSPAEDRHRTEHLVRAVSAGDVERFEPLYERLAPALHAWARLRILRELRGRVEPDDLVQEVWIRTLELFPRYDNRQGEFRPWLFGVAKHVLLEATRRVRSGPPLAHPIAGSHPLFTLEGVPESVTSIVTRLGRDESIAAFVAHVRGLGSQDQQLLVHFGLEGMSGAEVAGRMGISREAAFKRWQRLLEQLRRSGLGRDLLAD